LVLSNNVLKCGRLNYSHIDSACSQSRIGVIGWLVEQTSEVVGCPKLASFRAAIPFSGIMNTVRHFGHFTRSPGSSPLYRTSRQARQNASVQGNNLGFFSPPSHRKHILISADILEDLLSKFLPTFSKHGHLQKTND